MNNHGGKRPGSGRPRTGKNTKQICLTLTKDQAKKLEEKAAMYNISISKLIIEGLDLDSELYTVDSKNKEE